MLKTPLSQGIGRCDQNTYGRWRGPAWPQCCAMCAGLSPVERADETATASPATSSVMNDLLWALHPAPRAEGTSVAPSMRTHVRLAPFRCTKVECVQPATALAGVTHPYKHAVLLALSPIPPTAQFGITFITWARSKVPDEPGDVKKRLVADLQIRGYAQCLMMQRPCP